MAKLELRCTVGTDLQRNLRTACITYFNKQVQFKILKSLGSGMNPILLGLCICAHMYYTFLRMYTCAYVHICIFPNYFARKRRLVFLNETQLLRPSPAQHSLMAPSLLSVRSKFLVLVLEPNPPPTSHLPPFLPHSLHYRKNELFALSRATCHYPPASWTVCLGKSRSPSPLTH